MQQVNIGQGSTTPQCDNLVLVSTAIGCALTVTIMSTRNTQSFEGDVSSQQFVTV